MAIKLSIIYYSSTGTTFQLAKEMEAAAKEAGAEVRLRKVKELAPEEAISSNEKWKEHLEATKDIPEPSNDDLEWCDAFILGTPTRYGLPSAQLKQFMDGTGPLWAKGKLVNKVVSSFTSTATPHGGQETTLININTAFYHWGCIIVAPGYADEIQFQSGNPYGSSFTSQNGQLDPDETARKAARFQAKRMVEVTEKMKA